MTKRGIQYYIEVEKRIWEIDIPMFFIVLICVSSIAVFVSAISESIIRVLADAPMNVGGLAILSFWLTLGLGLTLILFKEEGSKRKKKILVKQENLRR